MGDIDELSSGIKKAVIAEFPQQVTVSAAGAAHKLGEEGKVDPPGKFIAAEVCMVQDPPGQRSLGGVLFEGKGNRNLGAHVQQLGLGEGGQDGGEGRVLVGEEGAGFQLLGDRGHLTGERHIGRIGETAEEPLDVLLGRNGKGLDGRNSLFDGKPVGLAGAAFQRKVNQFQLGGQAVDVLAGQLPLGKIGTGAGRKSYLVGRVPAAPDHTALGYRVNAVGGKVSPLGAFPPLDLVGLQVDGCIPRAKSRNSHCKTSCVYPKAAGLNRSRLCGQYKKAPSVE